MSAFSDTFNFTLSSRDIVTNGPYKSVLPVEAITSAGLADDQYWLHTTMGLTFYADGEDAPERYARAHQAIKDTGAALLDVQGDENDPIKKQVFRLDKIDGIASAIRIGSHRHGPDIQIFPAFGEQSYIIHADNIEISEDELFNRFMETSTPESPIVRTSVFQGHMANSEAHLAFRPLSTEDIDEHGRTLFIKFNYRSHIALVAEPNQTIWNSDKNLQGDYKKQAGTGDAFWLWYTEGATEILDGAWRDIRTVYPMAGFQGPSPKPANL